MTADQIAHVLVKQGENNIMENLTDQGMGWLMGTKWGKQMVKDKQADMIRKVSPYLLSALATGGITALLSGKGNRAMGGMAGVVGGALLYAMMESMSEKSGEGGIAPAQEGMDPEDIVKDTNKDGVVGPGEAIKHGAGNLAQDAMTWPKPAAIALGGVGADRLAGTVMANNAVRRHAKNLQELETSLRNNTIDQSHYESQLRKLQETPEGREFARWRHKLKKVFEDAEGNPLKTDALEAKKTAYRRSRKPVDSAEKGYRALKDIELGNYGSSSLKDINTRSARVAARRTGSGAEGIVGKPLDWARGSAAFRVGGKLKDTRPGRWTGTQLKRIPPATKAGARKIPWAASSYRWLKNLF